MTFSWKNKLLKFCFAIFLVKKCLSFTLQIPGAKRGNGNISKSSSSSSTSINVVSKQQVAIYDSSELASIMYFLTQEGTMNGTLAARAPRKLSRIGTVTFVTGYAEGGKFSGQRIIGVKLDSMKCSTIQGNDNHDVDFKNENKEFISVGDQTYLYSDSVATLPPDISDADAISTAAAALCGVHFGKPRNCSSGKCVIVGGSDYALFLGRALSATGADVHLVTTRPMLNPNDKDKVQLTDPAVGKLKLPFTDTIGEFDSFIDTLEDEAKMYRIASFADSNDQLDKTFFFDTLKKQYNCERYISTITRSQRYVLEKGLMFARDPVLKYQNEIEKEVELSKYSSLRSPKDFGSTTLQKVFDAGITYKVDRNENGPHVNKEAFVRGWALSDLAELKTWPRATPKVRFGFPVPEDIRASIAANFSENVESSIQNSEKHGKGRKNPVQKSFGPYVDIINDVKSLNEDVVSVDADAIVFISASYCKTCKTILPSYQRMARIFKEEKGSHLKFFITDIATREGKQLGKVLGVESVPSFFIFKDGEQYGPPMKVKRIPSKDLESTVENLLQGKEYKK